MPKPTYKHSEHFVNWQEIARKFTAKTGLSCSAKAAERTYRAGMKKLLKRLAGTSLLR